VAVEALDAILGRAAVVVGDLRPPGQVRGYLPALLRRLGDRVEVVKGLMEGERIVGSASFLLDSESRMKNAAAGIFTPEVDPVCGMEVDRDRAKASGREITHEDAHYYFCSEDCRKKFAADPAQYLHAGHGPPPVPTPASAAMPKAAKTTMPAVAHTSQTSGQAVDPVCGMEVDIKEATTAARKAEHQGVIYYFCSDDCKKKFDAKPGEYLKK
jgi:YHS domain-containing protein